ncbi:MAG: hypothetical protein HDR71_12175 [Lachnospiraceae bacterium]|nr:hypothetical protein [Lachnospiraceae bacterium]
MKAEVDDYKKEIHKMVDRITSLQRIIRIYSYVSRMLQLDNQKEEG